MKPVLLIFINIVICSFSLVYAQEKNEIFRKVEPKLKDDYPRLVTLSFDGLILNRDRYIKLEISDKQIRKIKILKPPKSVDLYGKIGEHWIVEVQSRILIVLNGTVLERSKKAPRPLLGINQDSIVSMKLIDADLAMRAYGKKAKYGALIIVTKPEEE